MYYIIEAALLFNYPPSRQRLQRRRRVKLFPINLKHIVLEGISSIDKLYISL